MIAGSASGVATQMTANALTGQPLHEGVFRAAVMGAASGGLFAGVGYGVGRVLKKLPAVGGADFYVTPKGEAIPGKFYRYWFRRPDTLAQAKAGQLAAKEGGTYVSFDAIDDAIIAKGKLQIPYRPEYRVTGDTYSVLIESPFLGGNGDGLTTLSRLPKISQNLGLAGPLKLSLKAPFR
jgi:hypothetical protein